MRSKSLSLCAVLLALVLLSAVGCAQEVLDLSQLGALEEVQTLDPLQLSGIPQAAIVQGGEWTYPISYELLKSSSYIVLANKEHLLAEDYIPEDLVKLTCRKISKDPIQMRETAANALSAMFDAASADGVTLYAHSGYRSYRTQNTMYYNRLKSNNGKDDGVVQYPGASDHQTGLGIDVINKAGIGKRFTNAFADTKEGKWIAEHCWEFGFVLRYQADKEELTGITYESWHLRYVGVQVAEYMREHNLCLEEFTEEWQAAAAKYEGVNL